MLGGGRNIVPATSARIGCAWQPAPPALLPHAPIVRRASSPTHLHIEVVPLLVDAAHALQVRAPVEQQLLLLLPRQRHGLQAALPPCRVAGAADCVWGSAGGCGRQSSMQPVFGAHGWLGRARFSTIWERGREAANLHPHTHSLLEKEAGSRLISSATLMPSVRSAAWHSWQPRPTSWLSSVDSSRPSGLAAGRGGRGQGWGKGAGWHLARQPWRSRMQQQQQQAVTGCTCTCTHLGPRLL